MNSQLPSSFRIAREITQAQSGHSPIVALEFTVITHGLPHPENLNLARDMEEAVRAQGGVPATIAILDGVVHIGLNTAQLERLAGDQDVHKISARDIGPAIVNKWSGGTTVAGTMLIANIAGIRVFATGGIGGVHRWPAQDISADLPQLASTPMIVVCSGAKAILDIPATLEYLETHAVPVVGYRTNVFPAFYSLASGLPVTVIANSPQEVVSIANAHWELGTCSAVLVAQPPPEDLAIPFEDVEGAIELASGEAECRRMRGQAVTPYLLNRVSEITAGASLAVNLALLRNNARLGGEIAQFMGYKE